MWKVIVLNFMKANGSPEVNLSGGVEITLICVVNFQMLMRIIVAYYEK